MAFGSEQLLKAGYAVAKTEKLSVNKRHDGKMFPARYFAIECCAQIIKIAKAYKLLQETLQFLRRDVDLLR